MSSGYPIVPALQHPKDVVFVVSLLSGLFAFLLYWFVSEAEFISKRFGRNENSRSATFVIFTKYFGALVMGFLPVAVLFLVIPGGMWSSINIGVAVTFLNSSNAIKWLFGLGIPVAIAAFFSGKGKAVQAKYPEIRREFWTAKLVAQYGMAWFFYLLGYEILFRGVLFLLISGIYGFWPALAINLAVYSTVHIPKGFGETAGSLVLGFFLCLATWQTQTIWVAFLVHLIFSWTANYTAWKFRSFVNQTN